HRQHHGAQRELDGRGQALADDEEGRGAVLERLPEVTPEHAPEEDCVLDVERLLQAELTVQLLDGGLRSALGEGHLRGVSGQDAQYQEDENGHADQRQDRLRDPAEKIGPHQGREIPDGPRGGRAAGRAGRSPGGVGGPDRPAVTGPRGYRVLTSYSR